MNRVLVLATLVAFCGSAAAEEKSDPAAQLLARSYRLAALGNGWLAAASTFGITLYRPMDKPDGPPEMDGAFVTLPGGTPGVKLPDSVNDLAFHNGHLYAANGPRGVVVFEQREDGKLEELARVQTEGAALSVVPHGALLFVASGVMGVEVFDISDPGNPGAITVLDAGGYARHVLVVQEDAAPPRLTVYVANGRAGIAGFKLRDGCQTETTFFLKTKGEVRRITRFGDGLLFSQGFGGACYASRDLRQVSSTCLKSGDAVRAILPLGDKVYLADGGGGLMIANWKDLQKPTLEARLLPEAGSINGLLAVDNQLFLAADAYGLLTLPEENEGPQ
jgi:hypothetical protein